MREWSLNARPLAAVVAASFVHLWVVVAIWLVGYSMSGSAKDKINTVPLCLGVRGPALRNCVASRVV
jgi:hypothetical protein